MDDERTLADIGHSDDSMQIKARTVLWISWARIAVQHEAMARAAVQAMQQPGADQSRLLEQEAEAGMVSICAAAFALEALRRDLDGLRLLPTDTVPSGAAGRRKRRPPASRQLVELLKHGFDPQGLVVTWMRELKWLFVLRGKSVHYTAPDDGEPLEPHPLGMPGMNVAPSQVAYSAENATRAVDLLLGILERCRDKPKQPARDWSRGMGGAVDELVGRRGQEYKPWP
jgi:hypothetical protein